MSNWDLMMPGMGLTAIGIAGVTISYSGIAHTFIDGMHALTGLTMFIGLIFLSAGVLDGGVSTSNRAKATVLVIISIALGFGMFAFTMNSSDYTVTLAGLLMAVAFPAIIISYIVMKMPQYTKPVGIIVSLASVTGIVMWVVFGLVSPDTYMITEPLVEDIPEEIVPAGPMFKISILMDSQIQGNLDYEPDVAKVPQGHTIQWINEDSVSHTVTSHLDFGETFDSSLLMEGEEFLLDTNKLEIGEYEYFCSVHPWMIATLIIEESKENIKVTMPDGAGIQQIGQKYYDPEVLEIPSGTTVVWENEDTAIHTVTSGNPQDGHNGVFDSDVIPAGKSYQFTFSSTGVEEYYCIVHPWMMGSVKVN